MAFIQSFIDKIRTAKEGRDVRGSLADGIDAINKETESTTNRQVNLDATFKQLIINAGNSNAEVVAGRHDNTTGKTYDSLPDRLDESSAQLATLDRQKAEQSYVDLVLSTMSQGGPKELFYSLNAMLTKYPSGASITVLVFDSSFSDGAHSFIWDGTQWKDLGIYQSTGIAENSVGYKELSPEVSGINDYTTVPIYENGVVVAIEERNGSVVISRTSLNRNSLGKLVSTTRIISGKSITSTYHKDTNGNLISITKEVV